MIEPNETDSYPVILPPDTPLMCDVERAEQLFGLSRTTLYGLAKTYPDFPVRVIGRGVRYLVPDLYMWLRNFKGKSTGK